MTAILNGTSFFEAKKMINQIDVDNLQSLQQLFDAISLHFPISITDNKGVIINVNERFTESVGYHKNELLGNTHSCVKHEDTDNKAYEDMWEIITKKYEYFGIIKNRRKNGSTVWHAVLIKPILDDYEEIKYYFSFRIDISEFIFTQQNIKVSQLIDKKTDLYKVSKLRHDIASSKKGVLLIFGINEFYEYSNFFGEEFSNSILSHFARRLKFHYLQFKTYSFDEHNLFAVYKPLVNSHIDEALLKSETLKSKEYLLKPFNINGNEFILDINIGIASGDTETLEHDARMAYESANERNLELVYFKKGMNTKLKMVKENSELLGEIQHSLENDGVVLHYQPILNFKTNKINKYECLVRIKNRAGTLTMPSTFLPIAKKSRQYNKITKIVVEKAFAFFENKDLLFSINISHEDIKRDDFIEFLVEKLKNYRNPERVIFEILEDEDIMSSHKNINEIFKLIKSYGAKIAIDDFGVGYSNINNILSMDIDIIKIDGEIIKRILDDDGTSEMVQGLIKMASKKGIEVVAEYIENKEIQNKVKSLGFDEGQGYFIGKPEIELVQNRV